MPETALDRVFAGREAGLRAAFMAGATVDDMANAMRVLKRLAFEEGNLEALKIFLAHTIGTTNKGQRMLPPLNLPKSATLDQCSEAIGVILAAMGEGYLSQEEAEAYISVIDKRATIIRAKVASGEGLGDGARPIQVIIEGRAAAAEEAPTS